MDVLVPEPQSLAVVAVVVREAEADHCSHEGGYHQMYLLHSKTLDGGRPFPSGKVTDRASLDMLGGTVLTCLGKKSPAEQPC
jgi:hypothetical protein